MHVLCVFKKYEQNREHLACTNVKMYKGIPTWKKLEHFQTLHMLNQLLKSPFKGMLPYLKIKKATCSVCFFSAQRPKCFPQTKLCIPNLSLEVLDLCFYALSKLMSSSYLWGVKKWMFEWLEWLSYARQLFELWLLILAWCLFVEKGIYNSEVSEEL